MILLRFTRSNRLISHLIRFFTWSQYSHVEIVIRGEGYLGACGNGGVQLRSLDYDPHCHYILRRVACTPLQAAQVIQFAKDKIGDPYYYTAILGFLVRRDWHEPRHWFCSELVAAAFEYAKIYKFPIKLNRITPERILELPEDENE